MTISVPDLRGSILHEAEDAWKPLGVTWRQLRDWRTLIGTAHWADDEDVVGPTPEFEMIADGDDPVASNPNNVGGCP